jgi:hypothetical protein
MNLKVTEDLMFLQSCSLLATQNNLRASRALAARRPNSTVLKKQIEALEQSHRTTQNTYILSKMSYDETTAPTLVDPDPIERKVVDFDSFTDQQYDLMLGFSKDECISLFDLLKIPEYITLNANDHRRKFRVSGEHAFLYTLFRFRSPSPRLTSDEDLWHYDYSVLSKIFKKMVSIIDKKHRHRLRRLPQNVHKFQAFNECILTKLQQQYPGQALPEHSLNCALFVDCTRFRTARPSGAYWRQQQVFSGDHKMHCHGSQAVFGPDGIVYDWHDSPFGRFCDKHYVADSGVNDLMALIQLGNASQFWIYGDKAYDTLSHIRSAYHGAFVTPEQYEDNSKLSRQRVTIEWGFGKIKARCPFVHQSHLLKLQAMDVAATIRVATILTNAHSCMHHCAISLYFNCFPPTVEEYFA